MRSLIAFALSAIAPPLAALELSIPVGSYHFDRSRDWQEQNYGLGVEHESWVAGYYRNSYDKDTVYAGYAWRPLQWGWMRAGITALLASGYDSPVLVVPTISVDSKWLGADFLMAPTLGKASGFVGMQLRVPLPFLTD
ncbi:MAG: hypothetical protein REI94_19325 [Moraxellaceae bacterium]|nr:hypothetical protein [Moraxellaceae bacterium]